MTVGSVVLSRLDSATELTGFPVAFNRMGSRDVRELIRDAAALASAIAKVGSGRWLVFTEDSYAAAVTLIALSQTASVAVLAPNRQPETLRALGADRVGVILDEDFFSATLSELPQLAPLAQPPSDDWVWRAPDRDAAFAEFRTSGTTGDHHGVIKSLRHLEDEVESLEAAFGSEIPAGARIFATVSHQHIYGLLFRILWPLATGRPFQRDTWLHPQELLPRMAEEADCVLTSSPAHLKRMTATGELHRIAKNCHAVFSSGGALDAGTALSVGDALGSAAYEVLGSTETGGVAVRQQIAGNEAWTPFPSVSVELEAAGDQLVVTSSFASVGKSVGATKRRFVMGDRAKFFDDGTFLLLGRADRIVKIGEKRLSLPAMEADLIAHPSVKEAALLVLDRGSDPRVHAAVVLDDAGERELEAGGRRRLSESLSRHLAARWDRVLLPRAWRYIEELPRDAQGKTTRARLAALFEVQERDPTLIEESRDADRIERRLEVPEDLIFLQGHFEGFPLVAGVVQLRWVTDAIGAWLGEMPGVKAVEVLKFPEPLLPGQSFTLRAEFSPRRDLILFRLFDGKRTFASGRLRTYDRSQQLGDPP
jgi:acyl-coenzyme A synthetase/AMP-(fatty) acid ligase